MKTAEFIKKVEALGYEVDYVGSYLSVGNSEGEVFSTVSEKHRFVMDTDNYDFTTCVPDDDAEKITTLLFEYSATPLADREEEKRYRLRLVNTLISDQDETYLNLQEGREKPYWFIGSKTEIFGAKTIFTESEIAEMDITGFEKEEVE